MKKKNPSRLHTSKASRDRESYKRDVREGYAPLPFAGGLPKRMTDAEDRAATKKEREAAKKIMKMMKGGMMPKYPGGGMMPRKRGMMYQNGGPVTSLLRNLEMAPEGMDESGEEFIAMQADPTRESMRAYRSALYKDEDVAEALDGKYNVRDVKFRPFNERQEDMFGGPGAIPRMPSEFDFQASVPRDVLEDDEKRRAYMNTPEFKERQAEGRRAYELAMKRFGVEKQRFLDLMKGRGVDTDRFNENFFRFDAPGRGSKDYDRFVVR